MSSNPIGTEEAAAPQHTGSGESIREESPRRVNQGSRRANESSSIRPSGDEEDGNLQHHTTANNNSSQPCPQGTSRVASQTQSASQPIHPSTVVAATTPQAVTMAGHPQPYYTPTPQEESGSLALAVAAGGILGLTAAAAVRWLNGGDFYLFPPATTIHNHRTIPSAPTTDERSTVAKPVPADDSTSMELLVSRMQSQVDQHEQLLAKFQQSLMTTTTTTAASGANQSPELDQSMDLLLRHDDTNTSTILREIRSALSNLRVDHPEFSTRLGQTLDKLDTTLDGITMNHHRHRGQQNDDPSSTPRVRQSSYNPQNAGAEDSNVSLASSLSQLILDNPDATELQGAAQMLYLYVINLASHPKVPRYRKIVTSNETYQSSVANIVGANSLLQAVGFVERGNSWEWQPSDEESCLECLRQAAAALSILKVKPAQERPEALLQYVFEKIGLEAATPPRRMRQTESAFTTPVHADILSPPVTKKQLTPPLEVDFSALTHPLTEIAESSDSSGSPMISLLHREEGKEASVDSPEVEHQKIITDELGETAVWK